MSLRELRSRRRRRSDLEASPLDATAIEEPVSKRHKHTSQIRSKPEIKTTQTDQLPDPQFNPVQARETSSHHPVPIPESPNPTPTPSSLSRALLEYTPTQTLHLTYTKGDIFACPSRTLLLHACNCEGSWGAGIAAAFRTRFPAAYRVYAQHCAAASSKEALVGTALLIPPPSSREGTVPNSVSGKTVTVGKARGKKDGGAEVGEGKGGTEEVFIGCLFTSRSKGKRRDSRPRILDATGSAMGAVMRRVREWDESAAEGDRVGEVRMCKINSGLFGVPWEETRAVLEMLPAEGFTEVGVVSLPEV